MPADGARRHSRAGPDAARAAASPGRLRTAADRHGPRFNPAAGLDTVLVIGTIGATLLAPLRLSFATGAVTASALWFCL